MKITNTYVCIAPAHPTRGFTASLTEVDLPDVLRHDEAKPPLQNTYVLLNSTSTNKPCIILSQFTKLVFLENLMVFHGKCEIVLLDVWISKKVRCVVQPLSKCCCYLNRNELVAISSQVIERTLQL